jgi:serine/threonine protein kinase
MAEVWLAQRVTLGASKSVAVKLLAPNLATKKQYRDMFLEEARLSMLLNNSNIVQVFDAGEENGECFMAMEWLDGVNLSELEAALWEAGSGVPVDVALYVVGEVLRALDYAHTLVHEGATSIVHRDVSPANILLSMAGEVKLTDFGVARFSSEETSGVHVKGKLRYMPPEQLEGRSKEGTVDLYAVGAVLHEMLEGEKFRGQAEEPQLYRMILQGVMPELTDPTRVPVQVDALRRLLLEPQVSCRVASAREALQLLRGCPNYRSAALELQAMVRWYRDLQPGEPGYQERQFVQIMRTIPNEQAADTSVSGHGITAVDSARSQITRRQQRAAALVLVLAGLGAGCLGVTFAVSNLDADSTTEVAHAEPGDVTKGSSEQDERAEDEQQKLDLTAAATETGPDLVLDIETETETDTDTDETGGDIEVEPPPPPPPKPPPVEPPPLVIEPVSKPVPPPPPPPEPVVVKFLAGAHQFAYVKVAGKQLLIEPHGTIKLPPGTHTVSIRSNPNSKWVAIGRVKIQPGRSCVVELLKPKGVKVTP